VHVICSVVQMLSSRLNICRQIYISCSLFSNSKCAVAIHQAVRTRVLPRARAILFSERPTEENFHVCEWQNMGDVAQSQPRPQAPVRAWGLRRAALKAHQGIPHFPLSRPRVFLTRRGRGWHSPLNIN
jgi:hypothetical protein